MYAVANVKKFVDDCGDAIKEVSEGIVERAEEISENGILSGGSIKEVMGSTLLKDHFEKTIMHDPKHIEIFVKALKASGLETANNSLLK